MKFWETETEMKVVNGVKVMSSYVPENKPPYQKWMKQMKISHAAWYHDAHGKNRAEKIMENTGVEIKSSFEKLKESFKIE